MTERRPDVEEALDALPCGVLQTAADGTIRRVNRTFSTWVGRSREELVGKCRLADLFTVGGRIFHHTHWAPLLAMQGSLSEVKLDVVAADGTKIPMVIDAIRREEQGTIVHEVAAYVARDRDLYERELLRSRKRLEELVAEATRLHAEANDRALFAEQMMGIVSHDLRNPLSVVGMGARLLSNEPLSPSQQNGVARILRASERANRLIDDLLDFTQARLGPGLAVTKKPIDLHATVAESVEELAAVNPARTLAHVRAGDGGCVLDPNRIAQLVGNLVSNAVAYGDPQTPVTVMTVMEAAAASITVHNGGVPIPLSVQATIFDAMTRATTQGRSRGSVGLGLFIVQEIAKAHGGRASVESSAEHGTTFRVVLPCSRDTPNPA